MKQFKHLIKPYIIWASILIVVPLILIVLYAFTSDGNEVLTLHFTWANFAKFLEATYLSVILKSFRLGILTTLICLVCGYVPSVMAPVADTFTGAMASLMPPPNTQTPAALASRTTACAAPATAGSSSSETVMAPLGNEIRYFAVGQILSAFPVIAPSARPLAGGRGRGGRCAVSAVHPDMVTPARGNP